MKSRTQVNNRNMHCNKDKSTPTGPIQTPARFQIHLANKKEEDFYLVTNTSRDRVKTGIQLSTKSDQGYQWESENFTIRHFKRKKRGQPFPSR